MAANWDVVIPCSGFEYPGPKIFFQGALAECIDKKTGQIFVNNKMQVTNKHPLTDKGQPGSPTVHENIFCMGDVCFTPMNEVKSIVSMLQYLHVPVQNVYAKALGQPLPMQLPGAVNLLQMIPMGKNQGLFKFNKMQKTDRSCFVQKETIVKYEIGDRKGDQKLRAERAEMDKKFGGFLGMATGKCYCLPMHISK